MKTLLNKVAVVTGGTRGLGLELARLYAQEGALVVIGSRSEGGVRKAVAMLGQEGLQVTGQACDVSRQTEVVALRDLALAQHGRLDIWVNNAGLSGAYGPTQQVPEEVFEQVIRTNIFGTYYGSLAALDAMLPRHSGHLINLMGRGDKEPVPYQTAYAATKSWVRSFTLALARENKGTGVHIHALNPGLVQTDMLELVDVLPGYEKQLEGLPLISGMWGQPPAVAARPALELVLGEQVENRDLGLKQILLRTARFGLKKLLRQDAPLPPLKTHLVQGRAAQRTE